MARRTRKGWSYLSGEKGRNRVRIFERPGGSLTLEFRDDGERKRIALGHSDRKAAKRKADEVAAKLARAETVIEEGQTEIPLSELFDIYLGERTPTKNLHTQGHDRRASEMFVRYFGRDRVVSTLNLQDWDRFIRDRRSGAIKPANSTRGGGVEDPMVEQDLRYLLAVLNWATLTGDGGGGVLLERNPFKGYRIPKEKNPRRVVLTDVEYRALLQVARDVDWRFSVALVLAHETGHRIGAISALRWSDIDIEQGLITWRAENEKTGYEHVTPITDEAQEALEQARRWKPGIGEAPVLPAPGDPSVGMSRHLARDWWKRAERLAALDPKPGRGWHSLRRKFASDLIDKPLKILCQLGGWKSPQTVLMCYQHPDEDALRDALNDRRSSRSGV